jgi:CheY-like chemotaxis protein
MSGLSNVLTPYSHLLFANRDKVIVVLALILGWTVIQLLVARWRTERLERDLSTARSGLSTSPARVRATASTAQADEAPGESGVLPPIKGGRSYARNLGSALQKAGIPPAGPQLYSPPVPAGWNPNTGTGPGAPAQPPMQGPTYAPAPAPWGAPPAQPAPWAYPAGANRPPFPAQPATPTPPAYAQPPAQFNFPSPNQGQPVPNFYPQGPAFGPSPFPPMTNEAPAAPATAAPTAPAPLPAAPPLAGPAPVEADDSSAKEGGRRGKPKRRRFNLSVLDSLEKMVQPKAAAPAPAPPVDTVASWPAAPEAVAVPAPVADAEPAPRGEPLTDSVPEQQVLPEVETEPAPAPEPAVEAAAEPAPEPEPEVRRSSRTSMRAMLFGEEPTRDSAPQPATVESTPVVETAAAAAAIWPAEEVVSPEAEPVTDSSDEATPEPVAAAASEVEAAPAVEVNEPEHQEVVAESEPSPQPELTEAAQPEHEHTQWGEPPGATEATAPNAGTLVIIEDDQVAAEYYATLFRGNGYHVDVANDGVSGVDLCARVQPQVILLDVMMPRQNGILVLQTLRASDETKNTPVVVMSNFSEPTLIKRALQLGALEYVIKTQVEGPALLMALPHWLNREKAFAA